MAQLYINLAVYRPRSANERLSFCRAKIQPARCILAMSTRPNRTAKAYWRSPASTTIGRLNAKALPDDAAVWARAVESTASRKAKAFMAQVYIKIALGSRANSEAEACRRIHTPQKPC